MDKYSLTRRADNDLVDIAEYTIKEFGIKQARRYRDAMELCFLTLTENPYIGQDAKEFAPDLRCFEHRSHLIFLSATSQRHSHRPHITQTHGRFKTSLIDPILTSWLSSGICDL